MFKLYIHMNINAVVATVASNQDYYVLEGTHEGQRYYAHGPLDEDDLGCKTILASSVTASHHGVERGTVVATYIPEAQWGTHPLLNLNPNDNATNAASNAGFDEGTRIMFKFKVYAHHEATVLRIAEFSTNNPRNHDNAALNAAQGTQGRIYSWGEDEDRLVTFRNARDETVITFIPEAQWATHPLLNPNLRRREPGMNPAIVRLARTASAVDAVRQGLIQCGFELEFQKLNGISSDGNEDGDVDHDALAEASAEAWYRLDDDDKCDELDSQYTDLAKGLIENSEYGFEECYRALAPNSKLRTALENAIDSARDSWREGWESDHEDDYRVECDMYDTLNTKYRDDIDCGDDPSVSGGEIRTEGAKTPMKFIRIADDLLSNNRFKVDNGCSFHIHLSVPGVRHNYGIGLQAEMTAYLLENWNRLPESVRERLGSDSCRKYATLHLSQEKYTAVHFHPQKTWEFRLFGNVNTSADARRCLMLAIEALRHAYRVKLGLEKTSMTAEMQATFRTAAEEAVRTGQGMRKAARAARRKERTAA